MSPIKRPRPATPRSPKLTACQGRPAEKASSTALPKLSPAEALSLAIVHRRSSHIPRLFKTVLSGPSPATSVSSQTFRAILSVCLSSRDVRALSTVLQLALSSHLVLHLRLPHLVAPLRALASAGCWQSVFSTLDTMAAVASTSPRLAPDSRLLVGLANVAVEHGAYANSLRVFSWMRCHTLPLGPIAYSVMLKSHGRAFNVVAVKKVLNQLRELRVPVDTVLLNTAVDALVRCNDVRAARNMLLNQTYASTVDATTYNTVIKGFVRSGQTRDAFQLASRMQAAGHHPDAVTVNTLMLSCVSDGNFDTAWQLFEYYSGHDKKQVPHLAPPAPPRPQSPPPKLRKSLLSPMRTLDVNDTGGLSELHPSANKEQSQKADGTTADDAGANSERAFNVVQRKELPDENTAQDGDKDFKQLRIAMTTLLCGLAEAGHIRKAFTLLDEMYSRGVKPNTITYSSLISTCFKHGHVDDAMILYDLVSSNVPGKETPQCDLNVFKAVITGLCSLDDVHYVEEAADIVDYMLRQSSLRRHQKRDDSYLSNNNDDDDDDNNDMTLSPECKIIKPSVEIMNTLLQGLARFQRLDRAEYYLGVMGRYRIRPTVVSYTTLMKGYADVKDYVNAKRFFWEMKRRKLEPDGIALNAFVVVCARSGDVEAADRVLEVMEQRGGGLSPTARSYSPILMRYAREQNDDKLWRLYGRMREQGVLVNDYIVGLLSNYIEKMVFACSSPHDRAKLEALACNAGRLLRDGLDDSASSKMLRYSKRRLTGLFNAELCIRYFGGLETVRSASETIFERHGWNDIQSGWRFL